MGVIYLIRCVPTGKIYIGKTIETKPEDRWNNHLSLARTGRAKTHLANAIRKYGEDAFTFSVIEECHEDELNERERYYIAFYRSNNRLFGYNMTDGGDGGYDFTPEVRQKISKVHKGVKKGPMSQERKEAIRKAKLSQHRKHSAETIEKIRAKRLAYKLTKEHKQNISKGLNRTKKFKLTNDEVLLALELLKRHPGAVVARMLGVHHRTIYRIRDGVSGHPALTKKDEVGDGPAA